MNKIYDVSSKVLKQSITNCEDYFISFQQLAKENSLDEKERRLAIILINSFFRNYYFCKEVTHFIVPLKEENLDIVIIVGLYFCNNALVKVIDENEMEGILKEELIKFNFDFSKEEHSLLALKGIVREKRKTNDLKVRKGSPKYFSIKYNLPEWFYRMVVKHYDKDAGIKTCREFAHLPRQFASINTFKAPVPNDENLTKNFTQISEGTYEYTGKAPFKRNELVKNKNVINIQLAYNDLLSKLPTLSHRNYAIYLGIKSYFYLPLISKYYKDYNFTTIITKHLKENYELLSIKREYNLKSLYFSEASSDGFATVISKKQDLFIVFPSSSEFEKGRVNPDYLITFDSNKLDELIKGELADLENAAPFVEEKGTLVYCVRTLGKKETTEIIAQFLEKHPEFELVEDKQYLPYEEENSLFYYAILKRK